MYSIQKSLTNLIFKLKLYSVHPNPLYVKTLPEIIREKGQSENARVFIISTFTLKLIMSIWVDEVVARQI